MKRSNFTFFFLFAMLSFFTSNVYSQASASCKDVNVTVASDCTISLSGDVLGASSAAGPTCGVTSLTVGGTPIVLTNSGTISGLVPGNTYVYEIEFCDGGRCWGNVNVESKLLPPVGGTSTYIWCGETIPTPGDDPGDLATLSWIRTYHLDAGCYAPYSNLREENTTSGTDICSGIYHYRSVYADFYIDGKNEKVLVWEDYTYEETVDGADIDWPLGTGDDFSDAISVWCGVGTDPASIAKEYGDQYGYPYEEKDPSVSTSTMEVCVETDSLRTITLQGTDDNGNDYWYDQEVTVHYDSCYDVVTSGTTPNYVPFKKGKTCNIEVKCQDMYFTGCMGPDSKIMRTWTVVDWCSGSVESAAQWITVVDTYAPVINPDKDGNHVPLPDVWVSIAPWTCAAEHTLPTSAVDDCTDGVTWEYTTENGYISGGVLKGLWKNESPVTVYVTVIDDCGNRAYDNYEVYIYDNIPPVMIAEDQVNVTLTGDIHGDDADNGVAKVYTHNIDAGSHDAGCGDLSTCVLLKEELENPIYDHYGNPVYVDGQQIYHAAQCQADGTIELDWVDIKGNKTTTTYDYVICKDFVKFCCADAGDNQVALVGNDNMYSVYHPYGNESHTWTTVTVEDKTTPIVYCAKDIYLYCEDDLDIDDLRPSVYSALCTASDLDYTTYEHIDACGYGYIEVTWTLDGEVVCVNYADYHGGSQFDPYNIRWPKHYDGGVEYGWVRECEFFDLDSDGDPQVDSNGDDITDGDGNGRYGIVEYWLPVYMGDEFECEGDAITEPVWCDAACSLVGSNYEDLEVDATDACRKVIRRWTVIDWCVWDPNSNGYHDGLGNFDDENDHSRDRFEAVDDEWLAADGLEWVLTDPHVNYEECEECLHNSGASDHVYFRYERVDNDGYYTFDQVIKVIDTTDPTIDAPAEVRVDITDGNQVKDGADYSDCKAEDTVTATAADLCGESELDAGTISWYIHTEDADGNVVAGPKAVTGSEATMSTGYGYPGDVHTIVWQATDGCGNVATAETEVNFVDTKNPTPVCLQDISTATMNNAEGSVTIWATDYDLGSFDNCSEVTVMFRDTAGNDVPSLTFTCADIPNGVSTTIETKLYVYDATGNYDYCFVTLRIDDNSDACDDVDQGAADLGGIITNRTNDALESAEVTLSTGDKTLTPVEGTYAFKDNTRLSSYSVSASKNDDPLNGVSTLDAVLLQKHILGLVPFNDPYKAIAGDVNNSGTITALDIVEMRKLILGVYTELPNNQSWRFVDAKETFADDNNPFPFTEKLTVASLENSMMDLNFIAVKIADVSGNSIANSLQVQGRSSGTLSLQVEDRVASKGSTVSVDVRGSNFSEVSGYQFTMELSGLEFVGAESGAIEVSNENFGLIDAATVTTAWHSANAVSTGDDVLFTMTFKANADVNLSEALTVSSRVTNAVAYTGTDYSERNVEMTYTGEKVVTAASYELGQNEPNPFADRTTIGFVLPKSGKVTFSVFDVTGKLVVEKKGEYAKGANTITLTKDELGATSGVLYYQMKSGEFKASRKMIMMN